MKIHYYLFSLICISAFMFFTCERDDICPQGSATTPQLVVSFFDATSIEDLKNITNLSVYAEQLVRDDNGDLNLPTTATNAALVFNSSAITTLNLPLAIGADSETTTMRYIFESDTDLRLDNNAETTSNIDILEITYTNDYVYISRACGFSNYFNLTNVEVDNTDTDNWITIITIANQSVQNETETHVNLFH